MEKVYKVDSIDYVYLGRCGENLARTVRIDVSAWLARWPDAAINLLHRPRGSEDYYIADTALDGGVLTWVITAADVAAPGRGRLEIRAIQGETIKKSMTGVSIVDASLTGSEGEPPDPQKPWVDSVLAAAATAGAAAAEATQSAAAANASTVQAAASVANAAQSATEAQAAAAQAAGSAGEAQTESTKAAGSAAEAQEYAASAEYHASAAQTARTRAENAKMSAETAQAAAETAAGDAKENADAAASSASAAAQSAADAQEAADAALGMIDDGAIAADSVWSSIKTVDTLCPPLSEAGNPVQCYPVAGYPLGVKASWEPRQEGEGDPSPDNVRPITGLDEVTVTLSDGVSDGTTATLNLPSTVYGGEVDLATGEGKRTVDVISLAVADMNNDETYPGWKKQQWIGDYVENTNQDSMFSESGNYIISNADGDKNLRFNSFGDVYFFEPTIGLSQSQFKVQYPDLVFQFAFKRLIPATFQATGSQSLPAISGENVLITNADSLTVTGRTDPNHTIQTLSDRIAALESETIEGGTNA